MQPIVIQDERTFVLEGHALTYDCYFIDSPSYNHLSSNQDTFKAVLSCWASALGSRRVDDQTFFFPYSPEDEYTGALKGTIHGSSIILTQGELGVPGFAIDYEKLEDFIHSPNGLFPPSKATFSDLTSLRLIVDVEEFIEKLKNALVIDKPGVSEWNERNPR